MSADGHPRVATASGRQQTVGAGQMRSWVRHEQDSGDLDAQSLVEVVVDIGRSQAGAG
jgi:hypothetical protein